MGGTSRRLRTSRLIAALAPLLALTLAAPSAATALDKVMLVSWDGVERSVMYELLHWQPASETPVACPAKRFAATTPVLCGQHWSCLPNLCQFQIIDSWDSEGKPLTRPQHAQMLSGYSPRTTGIFRNSGSSKMPPGYTLYERIKALVGPDVRTVHVAGRKYVSRGVMRWAAHNGSVDYHERRGGPDRRTGWRTTARVQPLIQEIAGDRFFVFIHYKEADITAHIVGDASPAYKEAIMLVDRQLGQLLSGLDLAGVLEQTAVLVTTDHGFNGRFHSSREHMSIIETWIAALNVELRTDVPAKLLDLTPTILSLYGVEHPEVDPPLEGESLLVPGAQPTTTVEAATTTVTTASTTEQPTTTSTTTSAP